MARDDWDLHWVELAAATSRNPAQALRRRIVRSLLRAPDRGARILDVGCGQGDLIADVRRRWPHAELCGIDRSSCATELARSRVPDARFVRRDVLAGGDPDSDLAGWATHAVCSEVLEHVDEPALLVRNARGYFASGCRLVVTVPGGPMSAFDRHIGHRRHYTPASLRSLLTGAGLEVEMATGAAFPFFNLFRMAVILRGEVILNDARGEGAGSPSLPMRAAMGAFRPLLALPVPHNRWGWQIVGVAR
ncbi:MAG TPA: class I SAM-dependent methyltransferase, partial [Candidatus Dormibacteraeota bacterium]